MNNLATSMVSRQGQKTFQQFQVLSRANDAEIKKKKDLRKSKDPKKSITSNQQLADEKAHLKGMVAMFGLDQLPKEQADRYNDICLDYVTKAAFKKKRRSKTNELKNRSMCFRAVDREHTMISLAESHKLIPDTAYKPNYQIVDRRQPQTSMRPFDSMTKARRVGLSPVCSHLVNLYRQSIENTSDIVWEESQRNTFEDSLPKPENLQKMSSLVSSIDKSVKRSGLKLTQQKTPKLMPNQFNLISDYSTILNPSPQPPNIIPMKVVQGRQPIFGKGEGAHENRFVSIDRMPAIYSKVRYAGSPDMTKTTGREGTKIDQYVNDSVLKPNLDYLLTNSSKKVPDFSKSQPRDDSMFITNPDAINHPEYNSAQITQKYNQIWFKSEDSLVSLDKSAPRYKQTDPFSMSSIINKIHQKNLKTVNHEKFLPAWIVRAKKTQGRFKETPASSDNWDEMKQSLFRSLEKRNYQAYQWLNDQILYPNISLLFQNQEFTEQKTLKNQSRISSFCKECSTREKLTATFL